MIIEMLREWKAEGLKVVGEAANGQEALELCRQLRPHLVLMDVAMPKMDGLDATQKIKTAFPRTIVLILTGYEDPSYLAKALRVGAGGYVLKNATASQIISSIRRVLEGEFPLNQEVALQLLLRQMDQGLNEEGTGGASASSPQGASEMRTEPLSELLTPREIEVLRLIVEGKTNRDIAQSLSVALTTVKHHVHRIISKLGVSDRTQAAVQAVALGLLFIDY
jgi:NarL family two-component system response regulator LiaR